MEKEFNLSDWMWTESDIVFLKEFIKKLKESYFCNLYMEERINKLVGDL